MISLALFVSIHCTLLPLDGLVCGCLLVIRFNHPFMLVICELSVGFVSSVELWESVSGLLFQPQPQCSS